MTKTVIIPDDIHLLIIKRQIYIRENYGVNPRITDMLVAYIKNSIDKTEELLNIKTSKNKEDVDAKTKRNMDIEIIDVQDVRI